MDPTKRFIVRASDSRARFLLARKGMIVPDKDVKKLGLTEKTTFADEDSPKQLTTSPEAIEGRSTRPEKASRIR